MPAKFSIVVPTRNRPQYLGKCLETCVDQELPPHEIIVCDNSDKGFAEATRAVADSLNSPLIRYIRPPERLCMTDNWNAGLQAVTGDYVTILGDDDGLLPFCTSTVNRVLAKVNAGAVRWNWAYYCWPTFANEAKRNLVTVAAQNRGRHLAFEYLDAARIASQVVNNRLNYTAMPMLYNSFVRIDTLERITKDRKPVLDGLAPDLYSGFAVLFKSRRPVSIDYVLGIAGQGGAANGASHISPSSNSAPADDFRALNAKGGKPKPEGCADVGVFSLATTDAFVRYQQRYPDDCIAVRQDQARLADWQSTEAALNVASPKLRDAQRALLMQWFVSDKRLAAIVDSNFRRFQPVDSRPSLGLTHDGLAFSADDLGASDVQQVASILAGLLGRPEAVAEKHASTRSGQFIIDCVPPALLRLAKQVYRRLRP